MPTGARARRYLALYSTALSGHEAIIAGMATAVGPAAFTKLRAQSRADYWAGMALFRWCMFILFYLLLFSTGFIIDAAMKYDTFQDILLEVVKPLGVTDYSQALYMFHAALLCLAGLIFGSFVLSWMPLVLIALWQRRHSWRILNETDLLWLYIMSDRITGGPPVPRHWWYRLSAALGFSPKRRRIGPGTVEAALTNLTLQFDSECRGVRRRGSPALQIVLQWLIVIVAIVAIVTAHIMFVTPYFNLHPGNPQQHTVMYTTVRATILSYALNILLILTFQIAAKAIPAARRIGIRLALMHYFTTDDLAAGLPRCLPAELNPLR